MIQPFYSYNGALCLLSLRENNPDRKAMWLNPQPGGADFMRPYLMSFEPETEDMVRN